mmetsp:Transcript_37055/g.95700  ORF Transcript_37055/g.95700 Transcript_37055/m.95700 type:complete len:283 (-) Transcript_37055:524-1372(-)
MADTSTHAPLGTSEIVWVVLLAMIINKERPGVLELVAVAVSATGNLVALSSARTINGPFLPLFLNVLAPGVGALCVSTLRHSVVSLFDPSNRLRGTMTKIEFTAIMLTLSSFAALASAMIVESGLFSLHGGMDSNPWWVSLAAYPSRGTMLILASGILTALFHVSLAWLAWITSATAVGMLGEVKVVPQWTFIKHSMSSMYLVGAGIGIMGSVLFACASYITHTRGKLIVTPSGFQWQPCVEARQKSECPSGELVQTLPTTSESGESTITTTTEQCSSSDHC